MASFDPNAASSADSGIFGLPYSEDESRVVYLPIPWEATTSYRGGTAQGPEAILNASRQVDLYHRQVLKPYEAGLHMLPESDDVHAWNAEARPLAENIIAAGGRIEGSDVLEADLLRVNELSEKLNDWVTEETTRILAAGRIPALVGGDHSTPFGALRAVAKHIGEFDVLQFDGHCDYRCEFEGFRFSHASIMHNTLTRIPQVRRITQVGIRDFCEEEVNFAHAQGSRAAIFFDEEMSERQFNGESWNAICDDIISCLGDRVWISFDIDGLEAGYCPNTGTPTPGGLSYAQAAHLIARLGKSGRRIVGFDLNEVAPDPNGANEWDGNVGARLLYHMTAWTLFSQGAAQLAT